MDRQRKMIRKDEDEPLRGGAKKNMTPAERRARGDAMRRK
jgi:hypothetical protein